MKKVNTVTQLKDFLTKNYKPKIGLQGNFSGLSDKEFSSLFIKCKEAIPQVTQSLLRAILCSDFIDNL
jgi:hypothetical protein